MSSSAAGSGSAGSAGSGSGSGVIVGVDSDSCVDSGVGGSVNGKWLDGRSVLHQLPPEMLITTTTRNRTFDMVNVHDTDNTVHTDATINTTTTITNNSNNTNSSSDSESNINSHIEKLSADCLARVQVVDGQHTL